MYKELVATTCARRLLRDRDSFYSIRTHPCYGIGISPFSVDEDLGNSFYLNDSEEGETIDLCEHLWIVNGEPQSVETETTSILHPRTIRIYSFDGEYQYSIPEIKGNLYILPADGDWVYLVAEYLYGYNTQTNECHEFGVFPLEGSFSYEGSCEGLHFFSWQTYLVALRVRHGEGFEEVYRVDLSEEDPSLSKNQSSPIHVVNFYQSEVWVATPNSTYCIKLETGEILSLLKDLPISHGMLCAGNLGYSISLGYYRVFDFKNHCLLREKRLDKFTTYEGLEYSAECSLKLLDKGLLYTSVYVPDLREHFLAVFDTQKEKFMWYGVTPYSAPIESIYIAEDRLLACDGHMTHAYQRTKPIAPGMDEYIKIKKIKEVLDFDPITGSYVQFKEGDKFYLSLNGTDTHIDSHPERIMHLRLPVVIDSIGDYTGVWWRIKERKVGVEVYLQIYSGNTMLNEFRVDGCPLSYKSFSSQDRITVGHNSSYFEVMEHRRYNLISPADSTKLLEVNVPYRLYEEDGIVFGYSSSNIYRLDYTGDVIWTCFLGSEEVGRYKILGIAHGKLWVQHTNLIGINLDTGEIDHQLSDCYLDGGGTPTSSRREGVSFLRETDKAVIAVSEFGVKVFDTASMECVESYFFVDVDPHGIGRFQFASLPLLQGNCLTFVGTPLEEWHKYRGATGWAGIFDLETCKLVWADSVVPWQEKKITTHRLHKENSRLYISGDKLYIKDLDDVLNIYQKR